MASSDDQVQPVSPSFISSQQKDTPPLPPRPNQNSVNSLLELPPAHGRGRTSYQSQQFNQSLFLQDPRSTSTQSLVPVVESSSGKRTLLLIYLHGFLGGEASFHSFPAHVHNLVTSAVAKTHVVHTKIYPRYKSRKAIQHARDEFSSWLHPHESANTDVVLLGHSMGGILSAEVTLLTSPPSVVFGVQQFRHRILGTINFDCPFLGLHPGIVFSGIGSLFRPASSLPRSQISCSDPEDQLLELHPKNSSRASSPLRTPLTLGDIDSEANVNSGASSEIDEDFTPRADPNYDPPFPNDIRLPVRKGWENTLHFITKHSHDLTKAARGYVTSHLEFGACVADYKGLQNRYMKLRPLEDIQTSHEAARRVRFLNYYTICHGRPKKPTQATARRHSETHLQRMTNPSSSTLTTQSPIPSPKISVEEHRNGKVICEPIVDLETLQISGEENSSHDESNIISQDEPAENANGRSESISHALESSTLDPTRCNELYSLAPLPSFPEAPQQYDPATYPDRESRNIAHKQYSAELKSYMRALKAYDQAINDRLKSVDKQEKIHDKTKKLAQFQESKKPQPQPHMSSEGGSSSHDILSPLPLPLPPSTPPTAKVKTPKERRFCVLPPRIHGQRDPCWIRVFMKDVDEVGAHCGLFVPGEHYAWFLDDVGSRIKNWVEGL